MYIPTWILVIGIIVAIYYFWIKRQKKNNTSGIEFRKRIERNYLKK